MSRKKHIDTHGLGDQLRAIGWEIPDYKNAQAIGRLVLQPEETFGAAYDYLRKRVTTMIAPPPFLSVINRSHYQSLRRTDSQAILDTVANHQSEWFPDSIYCDSLTISAISSIEKLVHHADFRLHVARNSAGNNALQRERTLILEHA